MNARVAKGRLEPVGTAVQYEGNGQAFISATYAGQPCGCQVTGSGTLRAPIDIVRCLVHEYAFRLLEALEIAHWHTDDKGRVFLCSCPRIKALWADSSKDKDDRHATTCADARKAIRAARGVK